MRRLRPVHRTMSWEAFQRIPRRLGWKHEYYCGMAHLRQGYTAVVFEFDLTRRPALTRRGIRTVSPADATALRQPFLEAFACAPEYAGYPMAKFRSAADEYIARYFGTARGDPSPVSVVAEVG